MALIDSGMGWSADENYMKQYAGKIGAINAVLTPGSAIPVATTASDIVARGLYVCTTTRTSTGLVYEYYVGADIPGCRVCWDASRNGLIYFSVDSTAHAYLVRYRPDTGSADLLYTDTINRTYTTLPSGAYYAMRSIPRGNDPVTDLAIDSYTDEFAAFTACTLQSTDINKLNDGYTTVAWVKYKTYSNVTSQTPVLISSVDNYTFFTGGHNETFTALYQGKRFYFSFSYDVDAGSPFSILTLDYTGSQYPVMSPALLFNYVANSVSLTVTETGDPWGDTPSEPGGGDGEPDNGDDVPFATPPASSAVASGFVTLFTPDLATLNAVAAYMWSSSFDINQIKKIFANPIDAILGLHIVPCAISPAGQKEIKVAGFGTGQYSGYTTNQYVAVSCGSVTIPKKWGSYLDYSPYTKTQIWLPFIGFREINIDDIQGKTISLQYIIDILSGACVAEVLVPCDDGTTSVLYSFTGSCAAEIPITAADMRGAISAAMSIAGGAVAAAATVASGGATAPMAAGVIASAAVNSMALKPTIQRSGTASGAAGYLAQRTPYIVREQPNIALPAEQNKLTGYPSFVNVSLDTLSGYNEIAHIHLENVPGTDAELSEIENLLHSGVIF